MLEFTKYLISKETIDELNQNEPNGDNPTNKLAFTIASFLQPKTVINSF